MGSGLVSKETGSRRERVRESEKEGRGGDPREGEVIQARRSGSRFRISGFDGDPSRPGFEGVSYPGEKVGPLNVDGRNFIGSVDRWL